MRQSLIVAITIYLFSMPVLAQPSPIEIFLIDAYVKPEVKDRFIITFFTSEPAKSKVIINDEYEYVVSDILTDRGSASIDISKMKFDTKIVPFYIIVEDSLGNITESELYDFDLPYEPVVEAESNFLLLCLFGGIVYGVPLPSVVFQDEDTFFSLTKEIPLFSIRSTSLDYPAGYFAVEYTYINGGDVKKIFRAGYKQIFDYSFPAYLSSGINFSTNFDGSNFVSPEFTIGWFEFLESFTLYTRYRYNFMPGAAERNFHEISLGLYTAFFSFYL
ncbi:MAG: hypothetical protein Kow0098_22600 [Ignavibacteriaceae bacterium]